MVAPYFAIPIGKKIGESYPSGIKRDFLRTGVYPKKRSVVVGIGLAGSLPFFFW